MNLSLLRADFYSVLDKSIGNLVWPAAAGLLSFDPITISINIVSIMFPSKVPGITAVVCCVPV